MKKLFTFLFLFMAIISGATTYIVDINGAGNFKSIQTAITNASNGDTIQVWPGTYLEAINLNKNVVLQGSGYENTIITGSNPFTVTISNGLLKWFMISSSGGGGVNMAGGKIRNCVVKGCSANGITASGTAYVENCTILNNGGYGIGATDGYLYIINCISWSNSSYGYGRYWYAYHVNISYSNGSRDNTENNQGCIEKDPVFTSSSDCHISSGSPCWNTGNPSLKDPDGSISDMGYFGGPDCPIYPVVTEMIIQPDGNNFKITAKGRANY